MCTATCRAQADTQTEVRVTKLPTSSEGTGNMVLYLTETQDMLERLHLSAGPGTLQD